MDNILLKDMPKHAERIENNFSLLGQIKDEIDSAPIHGGGGRNILQDAEVFNSQHVANSILKQIIDFVNDNYEWKGAKA